MAEAIARGVLKAGLLKPSDVIASDPSLERREHFATQLHVAVTTDNAQAASCRTILLAVKPQVMGVALDSLAQIAPASTLIISIAAGIKTAFIHSRLPANRIIRVMPNTPMLVGCGASALALGPGATETD